MGSEKVKVVYLGPCSGCFPQDLGFEVMRDVPFDAPEEWARGRIKLEPKSWRLFTEVVKPKD